RVHAELLASQLEASGSWASSRRRQSPHRTTIERVQKILLARAKTDGLEADARDWLKCATDDLLAEAEASSGESGQFSACAPPFATADHRARLSRGEIAQLRDFETRADHLRNRRSQVRILSGALITSWIACKSGIN